MIKETIEKNAKVKVNLLQLKNKKKILLCKNY